MLFESKGQSSEKSETFAGLELGGGKSDRTSLVQLDFYPSEKKLFLQRSLGSLGASALDSADEVLIQAIQDLSVDRIGVNAPLSFPPYVDCSLSELMPMENSKDPSVQWMLEEANRVGLGSRKMPTPYTQRALDVYLRTRVQTLYEFDLHLEETMGAGRAPLATRMRYLKSQLPGVRFLETLPRLALAALSEWYKIPDRELRRYRDIEDGAGYRLSILNYLQRDFRELGIPQIFMYETDMDILAKDLPSFNALLSGIMAVYEHENVVEGPESDYNPDWGFMVVPKRKSK